MKHHPERHRSPMNMNIHMISGPWMALILVWCMGGCGPGSAPILQGDPEDVGGKADITDLEIPIGSQVEVCGTTVGLNLREGPSTDYTVLDLLINGDRGTVLDRDDRWFELDLDDGGQGWASGRYLCEVGQQDTDPDDPGDSDNDPGDSDNDPGDSDNDPGDSDNDPGDSEWIWRPSPGTTWQWQLTGTINTSVDAEMFDIDLFDTSASTIAALKAKGRVVICYFSAGSYESWRPDAGDFPSSALGGKMDGWDELWLDIRSSAVRNIMKKRLDLAQSKGCDGVEPDNVDAYTNSETDLPLKASDQINYNTFLATEAHKRGLSIGLKNDVDQVDQLEPYFDWALNEECMQYGECSTLLPFIDAGKAVFHVEYSTSKSSVCSKSKALGFDTLIKELNLGSWYQACWD